MRAATEAEQTKIAALEAELQYLINAQEALGDDEDDAGRAVLEEKQDALEVQATAVQEKLDALQESFETPDPEHWPWQVPWYLSAMMARLKSSVD
ncbi:hypothetical protein [Nitrosospira lacus]|uniref:hypothetical protein n=1 Tax=Nitrosospira lacus TaxID=1288494 RepID=UPI000593DF2F|nr:hypothetical protein [Nitrosospira lacus]